MDEAVALAHLAGGGGDQIDAAPAGVAQEWHSVFDGIPHGADVRAQVVDAIVVHYLAIGVDLVHGPQAVLH